MCWAPAWFSLQRCYIIWRPLICLKVEFKSFLIHSFKVFWLAGTFVGDNGMVLDFLNLITNDSDPLGGKWLRFPTLIKMNLKRFFFFKGWSLFLWVYIHAWGGKIVCTLYYQQVYKLKRRKWTASIGLCWLNHFLVGYFGKYLSWVYQAQWSHFVSRFSAIRISQAPVVLFSLTLDWSHFVSPQVFRNSVSTCSCVLV